MRKEIISLIEKGLNFFVNLVTVSIIFNSASVSDVSDAFYVQSVVTFFYFLIVMGIPNIAIKSLSESKCTRNEFIASALVLSTLGWSLFSLIIHLFKDDLSLNFEILLVFHIVSFIKIFDVYGYALIALKQIKLYSYSVIASKLMLLTSATTLYLLGFNLYHVLFCFILESLVFFLFQIISYYYCLTKLEKEDRINIRNIISHLFLISKLSMPLIFSSVMVSVYFQSDIIMLKNLSTDTEVVVYTAAMKVFMPALTVAVLISNLYAPIYAHLKSYNDRERFIRDVEVVMIGIALLFFFIFFFMADFISLVLFNNNSNVALLIIILSVSWLFVIRGPFLTKIMVIEGQQKLIFVKTLIAALVNVGLNIILIPKYGAIGAATSSVFSYFVSDLSFYLLFSKTRKYFYSYFVALKNIHSFKKRFIRVINT